MTLDSAFTLAGTGLLLALWVILASKRFFSTSPAFFALLTFDLVGGLAAQLVFSIFPGWYLRFYLSSLPIDLLLIFWVLAEIGKNLLRYNRVTRLQQPVVDLLFVSAVLVACLLTSWTISPYRSLLSNIYVLAMKANEILEFAGFLTLVWWSSLRDLRWPHRELRIATGLGIVSFVWFLIAILHSWFTVGAVYHWLDQSGRATDLFVYAYWLYSFWLKADGEAAGQRAPAELTASQDDRKSAERTRRLAGAGIARSIIHIHRPE